MNKIQAIKMLRELHPIHSLVEAKNAVESWARQQIIDPFPPEVVVQKTTTLNELHLFADLREASEKATRTVDRLSHAMTKARETEKTVLKEYDALINKLVQ